MTLARSEQIAAWVEAARQGDRAAFGSLVRQFQDATAAVVLARLGPGPDVEDIVQDAFVAAYRQLGQLHDPAGFGSWVCGIARNLALRWLRDRRPTADLPTDVPAPCEEKPADLSQRIMASIQALPDRLREPLTLFYINGYSTEDVAGLLELPAGTVRRRLHEARHHLREHMESLMEDEIKKSAPSEQTAAQVLDRVTRVQVLTERVSTEQVAVTITDQAGRIFPMIVGQREGEALEEALGLRPPPPSPLLYDVLLEAMRQLNIALRGVRVTELKEHTFFARIDLQGPTGEAALDARPSDAINLALRAGSTIQVVRAVTDQAQGPFQFAQPEELREKLRAEPNNLLVKLQLARALTEILINWGSVRPWPKAPEEMAQHVESHIAEARQLLLEVLAAAPDTQQRRDAVLWLGTVEFLAGRWEPAMDAYGQYDGSWQEVGWDLAFRVATVLYLLDRHDEALARLTDAVAAIDRNHGTDATSPLRVMARAILADTAAETMPTLLADGRLQPIFEPVDPPALIPAVPSQPSPGLIPRQTGPAFFLQDRPLTIGSAMEADVQLSADQVEPLHARVFRDGKDWKIEDLGSNAGTFVQGKKINEPAVLGSIANIRLGSGPGLKGTLFFLSMPTTLEARPLDKPRVGLLHAGVPWPRLFPVPLAEHFRTAKTLAASVANPEPVKAEATLSANQPPPACCAGQVAWPVHKVQLRHDHSETQLTLAGLDNQQVILAGPAWRYWTLPLVVTGREPSRPMTEHLTAAFIRAAGLVCSEVVIGPANEQGQRSGRLHIEQGAMDVWLDTDPLDAIGVALALQPRPCVWVCESRQHLSC